MASVNVRRRALEAEALTLMMGAAWESVEEVRVTWGDRRGSAGSRCDAGGMRWIGLEGVGVLVAPVAQRAIHTANRCLSHSLYVPPHSQDIWKTTRCVGLLAGAGWTPESSPSPGQSSQPRPVDAVRRERARAMLRMGRQMVRWAEEWLGAAEAAAEGLRAHAESPLATSHHVAQAIKVSAERAVASG